MCDSLPTYEEAISGRRRGKKVQPKATTKVARKISRRYQEESDSSECDCSDCEPSSSSCDCSDCDSPPPPRRQVKTKVKKTQTTRQKYTCSDGSCNTTVQRAKPKPKPKPKRNDCSTGSCYR